MRVNYAAEKCGAKVLAFNPESENVRHILTPNKDEYLITPCHVKKWSVNMSISVFICVGELLMCFLDVANLPYRASFSTTFLSICSSDESL